MIGIFHILLCVRMRVCSVNLKGMQLHDPYDMLLPVLKYTLVLKIALIAANKLWNAISTQIENIWLRNNKQTTSLLH